MKTRLPFHLIILLSVLLAALPVHIIPAQYPQGNEKVAQPPPGCHLPQRRTC